MAVAEPILQLRDVSLSFKGIKALTSLSFEVARGEICALIGPNGAGKSSLLNVINGVYRADAGDIVFDGARFGKIHPGKAARLGIGRTFQHNALFKRLTVRDNVLAGLTRHGRTTFLENALRIGRDARENRVFRARADRIIAFLELTSMPKPSSRPCLTACRNASISPAPWLDGQSCFFSTSRWPE
jgi:branched-chain amino acid transport system ATP-binding protein